MAIYPRLTVFPRKTTYTAFKEARTLLELIIK